MKISELLEATGDKSFDSKLKSMVGGKSVISDKEVAAHEQAQRFFKLFKPVRKSQPVPASMAEIVAQFPEIDPEDDLDDAWMLVDLTAAKLLGAKNMKELALLNTEDDLDERELEEEFEELLTGRTDVSPKELKSFVRVAAVKLAGVDMIEGSVADSNDAQVYYVKKTNL